MFLIKSLQKSTAGRVVKFDPMHVGKEKARLVRMNAAAFNHGQGGPMRKMDFTERAVGDRRNAPGPRAGPDGGLDGVTSAIVMAMQYLRQCRDAELLRDTGSSRTSHSANEMHKDLEIRDMAWLYVYLTRRRWVFAVPAEVGDGRKNNTPDMELGCPPQYAGRTAKTDGQDRVNLDLKAGVDAVDDKPDGWVMEGVELSLLPLPGRMNADGTAHILTSRHPGSLRPWHADTPPWPWDRPLGDDPRGSRDEESIAYFLVALIKDSRRTQMAGRWSMTYFVCCQLPRLPRLSWVGVGVGWWEGGSHLNVRPSLSRC
ncbi:hypothetical protein BGZ61DRAFT_475197 [Ilyonectria robusta]|uniref:uncharacterized protein n=1 Tax=Ilyonectria robusta TaxID=1079257 RepID=UPI001E8DEAC2|nr:uncharacterized protein BGZ61DRAFT_475197 [Ilyonectria robusta]KAH8729602.1 hypothetical protein BGZ61DRAFT_475197 [Ilyonectria robusta]